MTLKSLANILFWLSLLVFLNGAMTLTTAPFIGFEFKGFQGATRLVMAFSDLLMGAALAYFFWEFKKRVN